MRLPYSALISYSRTVPKVEGAFSIFLPKEYWGVARRGAERAASLVAAAIPLTMTLEII